MIHLPFDPTALWPLPAPVQRPEPVGGGFSGALVFRLRTQAGDFALRGRSPEYDDEAHLRREHAVRKHLHAADLPCVPVPVPLYRGGTYLLAAGRFWDLSPWLPGTPLSDRGTTPEQWRAAFRTLARLHLAAATFPGVSPALQTSPGLQSRIEFARRLFAGERARLAEAAARHPWPDVGEAMKGLNMLMNCMALPDGGNWLIRNWTEYSAAPTRLQPCIGGIRADRILMDGDEVGGIVDWDSQAEDSVATDLACLLPDPGRFPGEFSRAVFAGTDMSRILRADFSWGALAAYHSVRPLSDDDLRLMAMYQTSDAVLAPWKWLKRLVDEEREFPDVGAVVDLFVRSAKRVGYFVLDGF